MSDRRVMFFHFSTISINIFLLICVFHFVVTLSKGVPDAVIVAYKLNSSIFTYKANQR